MTAPPDSGRLLLAWRSPPAWCILVLVFAAGLALDLASKSWAFANVLDQPILLDREAILAGEDPLVGLPPHQRNDYVVLPWGLLDFDLVLNYGAVFGIGQHARGLFVAFTIIAVCVATFIFAFKTRATSHWTHVGIALILAGGIGNLYDRIMIGAVRDFIHMLPGWNLPFGFEWPSGGSGVFPWVYNIADVLLLLGMGILFLRFNDEADTRKPSAADHPDGGLDVDQQCQG